MTAKMAGFLLAQLGLVAIFWGNGEQFLAANGPTFDEAVHLATGRSYWATGDFRLNVEHPPLPKLLWALPGLLDGSTPFRPDAGQWDAAEEWLIGNDFLYGEAGRIDRLLTPARRVNLLFGVGVVVLVGVWERRLWASEFDGVVASVLAAFDPTLVAFPASSRRTPR
jgi:dolichyl-phosphate-mannose--protein O-mannosyl transferase